MRIPVSPKPEILQVMMRGLISAKCG
jgi:hypothetical protein